VAIDQATDTIYVPNGGLNGSGDTVSVIDGATCNAQVTSGCDQTPPTITVGETPDDVAFDPATDTLYTTNLSGDTVSVMLPATLSAHESAPLGAHGSAPLYEDGGARAVGATAVSPG
jgi:DNA-binding beta-propeller fold protein YncE